MPITLAHPAVVLPLACGGLPMSALVIGAMVPDLPMFVPWGGYAVTHSITGALTVNVAITLALLLVWRRVVRDALVDMAPAPLRQRLTTAASWGARGWLLAVPAAALGALSHVVWDAFTHPGRWGVRVRSSGCRPTMPVWPGRSGCSTCRGSSAWPSSASRSRAT